MPVSYVCGPLGTAYRDAGAQGPGCWPAKSAAGANTASADPSRRWWRSTSPYGSRPPGLAARSSSSGSGSHLPSFPHRTLVKKSAMGIAPGSSGSSWVSTVRCPFSALRRVVQRMT